MGKPQDLPAGRAQLQLGVVLALASYVLALAMPYGIGWAFVQACVDLGCTGVVLWIALNLVGHPGRFEQAFGGLCGASALINLAAIPILAFRPELPNGAGGTASSSNALAEFVLLVWGLSLLAHVIRHTFEVRMVVSIVISFVYFILLSSLFASIMPQPDIQAANTPSLHMPSTVVLLESLADANLHWSFSI